MPIGKGYKMKTSKKAKGAGGHSAKTASLPSGRVSKPSKGKFNAGAYAKMRTKVFGLAKKEQNGKA